MKWANHIYYCIYRLVLKTPTPSYADAWPIAFLALTLWIHALTVYYIITRFADVGMASSALGKRIGLSVMVLSMMFFFWHYVLRGNGARVIDSFSNLGDERKYARIGLILFVETMLLPFIIVGLRLAWARLKG
jgi:hypothetical protein